MMTKTTVGAVRDLRQRAEEQLRSDVAMHTQPRSPLEMKKLLQELRVHQIELEMQNEELRLSQEELYTERGRYFDLYDLAPVGYLTLNDKGLIKRANLTAAGMIGVARNSLLHKPALLFIYCEDQDVYTHRSKLLMESGELQSWEMRLKRDDGSTLWVRLNATLAHNGECWITFNDITESKQTEIALEERTRELEDSVKALNIRNEEILKLSRAVEQSPVTIMITDTQGTIEFVNSKFTELTGYSAEEAVGQSVKILRTDQTPPETMDKMWATITAGNTWEGEFVNKSKGGNIFYEHATISALRDDSGAITQYVAVKEDITEKKSVMAQLIHAQKMESIGQMAGGLAHDLNNILSVVNGYASLAQLGIDEDQKVFKYLDEIIRASSRAALLTRSLLAYSRKQEMNPQKQNMNLLIETVGSFIKRIIHDNITFTLSLATEPLSVNVDTVQIEQVLLNLATNARDAMPDGGTFTIATAAGSMDERFIATHGYGTIGRYAIIIATDSGHGMDAETKSKVFDPFFTTKEVGKGTGLGLAMVLGIIKQHGGFIDLQSEPRVGSIFQLYLPLEEAEEVTVLSADQDVQREKASGTILVAEDDPDTRALLAEFLTMAGYTVITAMDGQDAVEKFTARQEEIELVISDVVMPRKSGKAASEEIRQLSDRVKFIFVSGHANDVILREGGFDTDVEIIGKPILPYELLKSIRALMPTVLAGATVRVEYL